MLNFKLLNLKILWSYAPSSLPYVVEVEGEEKGGKKEGWLGEKEKRKYLWHSIYNAMFQDLCLNKYIVSLVFLFIDFTRYELLGHFTHEENEVQES